MDRIAELKERFGTEPFGKPFHVELVLLEKGHAVIRMPVTKEIVVVEGFANGGFIVTLANSAGVYAAMSQIPSGHTRLLDQNMQFVAPSRLGETITGIAKVKDESKQFLWIETRIEGTDGHLKAFGIFKYNKPKG